MYKFFIKEIDYLDNYGGGKNSSTSSLTSRVGRLRPQWDDDKQNFDECKLQKNMKLQNHKI